MNFSEVQGDLFNSGERVVAHGCNCVGVMGAGVAKIVASRYPLALARYQAAIRAKVFNLGYAQFVKDEENDICIYNLATQRSPGKDASAWGVYLSFANMFEHAASNNISRVAIPRIGAGIGGLDWELDVIPSIIEAGKRSTNPPDVVAYYL